MKKGSKLLTATLVVTSLLCYSLPALADQTTPDSSSTNSQTQTTSGADSSQNKISQTKERIQNEILHLQAAKEIQPYMQQIKQLQDQEKQLRSQIQTQRQSVHSKIKADREAKNYNALLAALNDMVPMMDDLTSAKQAAQTCKADWEQLKTDRTAKNQTAITADVQKIQTDISSRISVYQKILADLTKINQDLDTPSSSSTTTTAPASTSSTTSS